MRCSGGMRSPAVGLGCARTMDTRLCVLHRILCLYDCVYYVQLRTAAAIAFHRARSPAGRQLKWKKKPDDDYDYIRTEMGGIPNMSGNSTEKQTLCGKAKRTQNATAVRFIIVVVYYICTALCLHSSFTLSFAAAHDMPDIVEELNY